MSMRSLPFSPLMKYDRAKAAHAATEPESQQPCKKGVLQLRARTLYLTGRRGGMCLPAAYFLFTSMQVVSDRRTSP